MDRRDFTKGLLASVASFALMDSLFAAEAFTSPIKPITDHWAIQLNEYCADLKKNTITPSEWQIQLESLYKQVNLEELLTFINFDHLKKDFAYPDLGVNTKRVLFPSMDGLPEKTIYLKKIFGMQKDRAIIPHGHSNMASAHLILEGEMHLRHYEKIRQEADHLIVQPTVDTVISAGQGSSISDERDNVHWFIANTAAAYTFDVILLDLNGKPYDIHNLDMYESVSLSDGTQRVPILPVETALKKYGKLAHH